MFCNTKIVENTTHMFLTHKKVCEPGKTSTTIYIHVQNLHVKVKVGLKLIILIILIIKIFLFGCNRSVDKILFGHNRGSFNSALCIIVNRCDS